MVVFLLQGTEAEEILGCFGENGETEGGGKELTFTYMEKKGNFFLISGEGGWQHQSLGACDCLRNLDFSLNPNPEELPLGHPKVGPATLGMLEISFYICYGVKPTWMIPEGSQWCFMSLLCPCGCKGPRAECSLSLPLASEPQAVMDVPHRSNNQALPTLKK